MGLVTGNLKSTYFDPQLGQLLPWLTLVVELSFQTNSGIVP
jgi:hypothetical protein